MFHHSIRTNFAVLENFPHFAWFADLSMYLYLEAKWLSWFSISSFSTVLIMSPLFQKMKNIRNLKKFQKINTNFLFLLSRHISNILKLKNMLMDFSVSIIIKFQKWFAHVQMLKFYFFLTIPWLLWDYCSLNNSRRNLYPLICSVLWCYTRQWNYLAFKHKFKYLIKCFKEYNI